MFLVYSFSFINSTSELKIKCCMRVSICSPRYDNLYRHMEPSFMTLTHTHKHTLISLAATTVMQLPRNYGNDTAAYLGSQQERLHKTTQCPQK